MSTTLRQASNTTPSWGWDDAPDLLTPAECSVLLRTSRTSCYESLRSGALRPIAIRWGRKYLIPKAALRRLIESEEQ
jgi:excisionase family DNA binding protein